MMKDPADTATMDLLEEAPRARATDPGTSHVAAARASEFAADQRSRILDALRAHGDMGAEQISKIVGLDAYAVRKRLPELERAGKVQVTLHERQTRSGRWERIWRALG